MQIVMCAKFEDNPINCLRYMAVFESVQNEEKKGKNEEKWATFWRLILYYLRNDLLQI